MDITFFPKGLIIGFSIAAPVGPIGVLCIRRTLTTGQLAGLLSGLGAATADAIYGVIAGFGLSVISAILIGQVFWLRLLGGLFLGYLGIQTLRASPAKEAATVKGKGGLGGIYFSTVLLTLTNPMTILSFVAVFAGLGLANAEGNYLSASVLVLGVFLGSAFWWVLLSSSVSIFRETFNLNGLRWLNRISGSVLLLFGIIALLSKT